MSISKEFTIAIPAYNRSSELKELFDSILNMDLLPSEVLVNEDFSSEREAIVKLFNSYKDKFLNKFVKLRLELNEKNVGYDKNFKFCISRCRTPWVIIMGNDDVLLKDALVEYDKFIRSHNVNFISRSFLRFKDSPNHIIGISSISSCDVIYKYHENDSKYVFRTSAFVGGLAVNVSFGLENETDDFDGYLYYQVYLAALAFLSEGIGYIGKPVIGGRVGNLPMFGHSENEESYTPGAFTPYARTKMWSGVLNIMTYIDNKFGVSLFQGVKKELSGRQSFHVFEMYASSDRKLLFELRDELSSIGLFKGVSKLFFFINLLFGKKSHFFYFWIRRFIQKM